VFLVLSLTAAFTYGAADFLGGLASRRANTIAVVTISQGAGLLMVALLLPMLTSAAPGRSDWIWGGIAGLTGGVGVALLYRALAVGVMAVVAPTTAVCAVLVPVLIAIALGERPGTRESLGIGLAVVAIVLVSQSATSGSQTSTSDKRLPEPGEATRPGPAEGSGLGLSLASGVAIGLFFLALARTNTGAGLWPLLAARAISVSLFAAMAVVYRVPLRMPPPVMVITIGGGIVDMLANLFFLLASRQGPLTLAVTLTSLYPASTVLLARVVVGERLAPRQWAGVAFALVAIVTIVGATQ
jgi:drug/metabolite transporter (DMT)-like permease